MPCVTCGKCCVVHSANMPLCICRYLSDQATAASVRSTFAGFHPLDKVSVLRYVEYYNIHE